MVVVVVVVVVVDRREANINILVECDALHLPHVETFLQGPRIKFEMK